PDLATDALFTRLEDLGARGLVRADSSVFEARLQHSGTATDLLARAQALLTPTQRALDEALDAVCSAPGTLPGPVPADELLLTRIHDLAGAMGELASARETALQRDELQDNLQLCG